MCIAFSFYYIWGCSCSYVLFVQCQIVYVSIHVSCRSSDTNVKADQKISTRRKIFSDSSTLFAGEQQERHGGKKFLIFLFTFPEFFVKRTFKNWTNLNTMEWTRKVNSGQAPANGKRLRVQTNTSCSREFIWLHRFQFFFSRLLLLLLGRFHEKMNQVGDSRARANFPETNKWALEIDLYLLVSWFYPHFEWSLSPLEKKWSIKCWNCSIGKKSTENWGKKWSESFLRFHKISCSYRRKNSINPNQGRFIAVVCTQHNSVKH